MQQAIGMRLVKLPRRTRTLMRFTATRRASKSTKSQSIFFVHTINSMRISFAPAKNAANIANRCLPFELVKQVDWGTALIEEDTRKAYGEQRFRMLGFIEERLHAVVFTPRDGKVHVISLRKANSREVKRHAKTTKPCADR